MARPRLLRPAVWRAQRWLLVFLTVCASGMHLTRMPGVGGLGWPLPALTAAPADTLEHAGHLAEGHGHDPAVLEAARGAPASSPPSQVTDLSGAEPRAPGHAHEPHCPFCLSAGFALSVPAAELGRRAPVPLLFSVLRLPVKVQAVDRVADPRAPPLLG